MTPEERQLLAGLFDRTRAASSNPRDPEAEALIADLVRQQPYAPYLLAQTVIVQEQALQAANQHLQELEARIQELEQQASKSQGSFLGGLGSSIFGSPPPQQQPRTSVPPSGSPSPWSRSSSDAYAPAQAAPPAWQQGQPAGGGWAQQPQPQAQAGGGSFLKGALGAAAGVAGGVLLANSISGLFRNNNSLGIGSGLDGAQSAGHGGNFDPLPQGRMGDARPAGDFSTTPASYEQDSEQDYGSDWDSSSDDTQDL